MMISSATKNPRWWAVWA